MMLIQHHLFHHLRVSSIVGKMKGEKVIEKRKKEKRKWNGKGERKREKDILRKYNYFLFKNIILRGYYVSDTC